MEFALCTVSNDYKIKNDEIDGVRVTYEDMRNTSKVLVGAYKGKKLLGKHRSRRGNNPYPTAFPYGNGVVLHFYQQQESSTTKTVHKVINKRLKTYV